MLSKSISEQFSKAGENSIPYPLLDKHWVRDLNYGLFSLPVNLSEDTLKIWLMEMSSLVSAYSDLLILPFDRFWCELIYQPSLSPSISSFLANCPRDFNTSAIPEHFFPVVRQLYALTLAIIVRASRMKESESLFLSEAEFRSYIYNCFVFDVPRLIDFVVLYGTEYKKRVLQVLTVVFTAQPAYVNDTIKTIQAVITVLTNSKKKIQQWQFDPKHQPLSSDPNALQSVEDTIDYLSEAGYTILEFLTMAVEACPDLVTECIKSNFHRQWAQFYDDLVVVIRSHILRQMTWSFEQKSNLMQRLAVAAMAFVKVFRKAFVEPGFLKPISHFNVSAVASTNHSPDFTTITDFLNLMIEILNLRGFFTAYAALYDLNLDCNLLDLTANSADYQDQIKYIRSAFSSRAVETTIEQLDAVKHVQAPPSIDAQLAHHEIMSAPPEAGPSRSAAFKEVKTVLSDVSDALIERCLTHYKQDSNMVINALLEDTVPIEVKNPKLVRPTKPEKNTENMNLAEAAATGVLQLKPTQIWQGKRGAGDSGPTSLPVLSNRDKERVKNMAVSVWDDDDDGGWNTPNENDIYEDEYDDSYDLDVGTTDTAAGGVDEEQIARELRESNLAAPAAQQSKCPLAKQSTRGQQRLLPRQSTRKNLEHKEPQPAQKQVNQRDIADVRLMHMPSSYSSSSMPDKNRYQNVKSDDEGESTSPPPQRNILRIENPEEVRARREHYQQLKAIRKGRIGPSNPRNVPEQPLPKGAEFFPETSKPLRHWSNAPGLINSRGGAPAPRNNAPREIVTSKRGLGGFTKSRNSAYLEMPSHQQNNVEESKASFSEVVDRDSNRGRGARGRSHRDPHQQRFLANRKHQF